MDRAAAGGLEAQTTRRVIDLNADLGEGEGSLSAAGDAGMLEIVTSVNIACGVHAGGPAMMRRTVDLAIERGIAIGAHPGLDDREGFGRRERPVVPADAYETVLYQIGALDAFVRAAGGRMTHVKPHGALYNMAARDSELADAIAAAVCDYDDTMALVGLAGSELVRVAEIRGLGVRSEVFADRRYGRDGYLVPRDVSGAVISDASVAARRVLAMLDGALPEDEAPGIAVVADTVCVHGDTPDSIAFARAVRSCLAGAGVVIAAA